MSREDFAKIYLDWVNNFLTVDKFASYYGLHPREAVRLIELGKSCHDLPHPDA
jgi:hypothetical protein